LLAYSGRQWFPFHDFGQRHSCTASRQRGIVADPLSDHPEMQQEALGYDARQWPPMTGNGGNIPPIKMVMTGGW